MARRDRVRRGVDVDRVVVEAYVGEPHVAPRRFERRVYGCDECERARHDLVTGLDARGLHGRHERDRPVRDRNSRGSRPGELDERLLEPLHHGPLGEMSRPQYVEHELLDLGAELNAADGDWRWGHVRARGDRLEWVSVRASNYFRRACLDGRRERGAREVVITRLRIGVIGAGGMGANHARVIAESDVADLAIIVDRDEARAEELAHAVRRARPQPMLDDDAWIEADAVVVAASTPVAPRGRASTARAPAFRC